jgi:hypothetical protein
MRLRAWLVWIPGSRQKVALDAPDTRLEPVVSPDGVEESGRRNSVVSAMRSLLGRTTRYRPESESPGETPGSADLRGSGGDGISQHEGDTRAQTTSSCERTIIGATVSETSGDSGLGIKTLCDGTGAREAGPASGDGTWTASRRQLRRSVSESDLALSLDDPQLVSPTQGQVVKSLRMMIREARLHKPLQHEAEDGRAAAKKEGLLKLPSGTVPGAAQALGLKWESIGIAKPATGTEIHRNSMLVAALARKKEFSMDELAAFEVSDLSYSSYIAVGDEYFRPAAPIGLTRQQQRSLRSLDGCPSPQMPRPALRALQRTAMSPAQSLGFQRTVCVDGPDVVDFSREASTAAKVRLPWL